MIGLEKIVLKRSRSRDAVCRELLNDYIARQLDLQEEDRLTHISTVLRYPPPPSVRTATDGRERVAFRLDPGQAEQAARYALQLPGQPSKRGPGHYSPRPLTDALVVAIGSVEPFVEDGLEGLPHLLPQSAARGLWRLTVAATLTNAEEAVLLTAPGSDLATVLSEEDVAWHSPWRFAVALHLARKLLGSPDPSSALSMLARQQGEFRALQHSLARTDWADSPLLADCTASSSVDLQGRGGAAVWRAERKLTESQIDGWVVGPRQQHVLETGQPGWSLTMRHGWHAVQFAHGQSMNARLQADVDHRRVLQISDGSRRATWPYNPTQEPVARFELVLAAAPHLSPASIVELVLLPSDEVGSPWVPAELATEWGMMSALDRDWLTSQAERNRYRVAHLGLSNYRRDLTKVHAKLVTLVDQPGSFARLAAQHSVQGGPFQALVRWDVDSIADVLESNATDEQVRWLIGALDRRRTRALERSMREASSAAYWLGRPDPEAIV